MLRRLVPTNTLVPVLKDLWGRLHTNLHVGLRGSVWIREVHVRAAAAKVAEVQSAGLEHTDTVRF